MASLIPENEASFTGAELIAITSGELGLASSEPVSVVGVTTDTRGRLAGKLFVALRGERFDGHAFVAQALEAGAALVLVERGTELPSGTPALFVDDTLVALGKLAAFHRRRWAGRVVAVAGSAGKTTTRSAIASVLVHVLPGGSVWSPPGNLNNRIGVPMVLLALTPAHQLAVVEIGTNAVGEVRELSQICAPNVAVLTLIDLEHTQGLGDLAGVEAEEGALFQALESGAVAMGNADDERVLRQLLASPAEKKLTYGTQSGADYYVEERSLLGANLSLISVRRSGGAAEGLKFRTGLSGRAGALAAACALGVSESVLGRQLLLTEIEGALLPQVGELGRLRPVELNDGSVLIDDSYNSNPASVISSVECARELAESRNARLVLVIGEMRELGALAAREHDKIGRSLAASGAQYLVAVGGESIRFLGPAESAGLMANFAPDSEAALALLEPHLRAGDVILVKASRGVRAERVVEGLIEKKGRAA